MFSRFWKNISQKLGQVEWTLEISQYFPKIVISIFLDLGKSKNI